MCGKSIHLPEMKIPAYNVQSRSEARDNMHGQERMSWVQTSTEFPKSGRVEPNNTAADSIFTSDKINISAIRSADISASYISDKMQTKTSKRIAYLLKHRAIAESVEITPQGYIVIVDIVKWLNKGTDGQI